MPVLTRPRVTDLIGATIGAHRVTLVSGPAGAGKTVACAAWAAEAPRGTKVAWVSLDSDDRKPARLWSHVLAALAAAGAGRGLASALPRPSDQDFPLRLAEWAGRLTSTLVLVLDDVSELAGAPALTELDQLIRHGPARLRLVLAGRHPASLPVARLRVGGELGEVNGADLACTPDEADGYFRMLGRDVPPAQRDELLKRTEGWVTGLRLAAMRTAGRPSAVVSRISGDEPAVADYLGDEVLAGLPATDREFLLRTSVTDLTCGDLADTLTGQAGGAALLEQLARENMLVRPAGSEPGGDQAGWYQYHPLLLDLLRTRLDHELPGERARLTRRAARWQAARGLAADAIKSAARAADWDFAGRVLADAGPSMLLPGPAAELEPVLAAFPVSRFADDVAVAGALAAAGLRTGDTSAAALHLDNAGLALHRSPAAQRERIEPWLTALRLLHAVPGTSAELPGQAKTLARQAERTTSGPGGHQGLGLLWCALGVTELGLADPATARQSFASARRHLADGEPAFALRAACWHALAEAVHGDLRAAGTLLDEVQAAQPDDTTADPLAD
ncbi:MAG TPA: AAA family ATPase, partial [Streptosporangiaceae bacterium]